MTQIDLNFNDSRTSQCAVLLAEFRKGRRFTFLDSLREFGIARIGARAWDLRNGKFDGVKYPIESEMIRVESGKRVACYFMLNEAQTSHIPSSENKCAEAAL